jgi:hypothetical protein
MSNETFLLYDFSASDVGAPPALDLEELFFERNWEKGKDTLTPEDIRNLKEGKKFLESVRRGQEIASQATEEGVISGDLKDFDAFQSTELATRSLLDGEKIDFDELIGKAISVIDLIIDQDNPKIPSRRWVELIRKLFLSISQAPSTLPVADYLSE